MYAYNVQLYIIMHIVLKAQYDINILNLIPTVDVYMQRTIFGTVHPIKQGTAYKRNKFILYKP